MIKHSLEELKELIQYHRNCYYAGKSEISDKEYDELEFELRELDPENELFEYVGFDLKQSSFEKLPHREKMLSLGKIYNESELKNWLKDFEGKEVIVSPKIDGFAITIKYIWNKDRFVLSKGITRGDGSIGEDITENVKTVSSIPKEIILNRKQFNIEYDEIEIRGEVYMSKSVFNDLLKQKKIEENSRIRNIAAGSMRQKDPNITKERNLSFFAYNLINHNFKNHSDKISFIEKNCKIPVVNSIILKQNDIMSFYNIFLVKMHYFDFNVDGLVIRINDESVYNSFGNTSHHPRAAIAFKFKAEAQETVLENIEWQVSRTGLINPVALYKPIDIDGAICTKATLHNLSFIEDMNLGIGDNILVIRQGGVIPKILEVSKKGKNNTIQIPENCPKCGSKTIINENKDSNTKTLYCSNSECPEKLKGKILHFCNILDIKGLSEATIEKLFDNNHIKYPIDIFKVTKEMLLTIEGFKDKSANNILTAIENSRKISLDVFIASLGIDEIGKNISKLIVENIKTIDEIINAKLTDYIKISGFGEARARNIYEYFKNNDISEYLKYLIIETKNISAESNILQEKSFCITGTLSKPRKDIEEIIERNGGKISSSVNKKLDYLIVGDDAGSKLEKAKSLNVKIITEKEFLKMMDS